MQGTELALLGGTPLGTRLAKPEWPPRSESTARRLADLYRSGNWGFSLSDDLDTFSERFAREHHTRHGVFMVNGTVTLMCALGAAGIGPGDEVIVPAYTWLATASAVRHVGAKIVFADVERSTLCLDPRSVEAAITSRTKAVIPVHFMGSVADMDALMAIANRHRLFVLEDCAQAHGSHWNGRAVGSIGHAGSFSFQQNKIMSCGEGGICVTNDAALGERMYRMAYIGYAPGESFGNFKSPPPRGLLCYNLRGTQIQAVMLHEQLEQLAARVRSYSDNARRIATKLQDIPGVRLQSRGLRADPQSCYKLAFVFDEDPLDRLPIDLIMRALQAEGLAVQPSYGSVPEHILFNLSEGQDYVLSPTGIPVARSIGADRVIMLSHQWLSLDVDGIDLITQIIGKVARNAVALGQVRLESPPVA